MLVDDCEAPSIDTPSDVVVHSCEDDVPVLFSAPDADDNCDTVTVAGSIVESNGIAVSIPLVGGWATLPIGEHTIEWTATDSAGLTTTVYGAVTVLPSIIGIDHIKLEDRAETDALLASFGTTELGADASSGTLLSDGQVWLRSRATVYGDVQTGDIVDLQHGASVTGSIDEYSAPPLVSPSLTVPGPGAGTGNVVVNSGSTVALSPGSHGQVIVNSNGTLVLDDGAYGMSSLIVNSGATLEHGDTSITLSQSVTFRGQQDADGSLELFVSGSGWSHLEADLEADVFAPYATVNFKGNGGGQAYIGQFLADQLIVGSDATLICVE